MRCILALCVVWATVLTAVSPACADDVIDFESRGKVVRGLLALPADTPRAVIVLLAGGHGQLGIGSDGTISALKGNQLVRTRGDYRKFGLATIALDLASDLDGEPDDRLTYATRYAADIAVVVSKVRSIAEPVVIAGTSRGSLRAAIALLRSTGAERPDALVLTSAYLMPNGDLPSVQAIVGSPASLPPTLVVHHRDDACSHTPPEAVATFRAWGGSRVRVIWLEGGHDDGDPCQAKSAHGFSGIDPVVVEVISHWVRTLPFRKEPK